MKKHCFIVCVFLCAAVLLAMLSGCSDNHGAKNIVYEDMKAAFESSGLLSANIGIMSRITSGDSVSYGECGSGVIFDKKGGAYYALTAAHVVSGEGAQLLVFTTNTEMKSESIPGVDFNVLSTDVYDTMYPAELLYASSANDLAVIRFSAEEDLAVIETAGSDPAIGSRIMCVGNPQNTWFAVSYGEVTSGIEKFGDFSSHPSNAMKHTAYIQVGSSGGAAINEQMKLVGITPGASLSLDGKTFNYGVLIPVSEINACLNDWKKQ